MSRGVRQTLIVGAIAALALIGAGDSAAWAKQPTVKLHVPKPRVVRRIADPVVRALRDVPVQEIRRDNLGRDRPVAFGQTGDQARPGLKPAAPVARWFSLYKWH